MNKSTKANDRKANNDVSLRKDFICWVHANPSFTDKQASTLYDRLQTEFPHVTRGGHRGMVGRLKPWETVVHECPNCSHEVVGVDEIKSDFGLRKYRGKVYMQSWCRTCRKNKHKGNGDVRVNPDVEESYTN